MASVVLRWTRGVSVTEGDLRDPSIWSESLNEPSNAKINRLGCCSGLLESSDNYEDVDYPAEKIGYFYANVEV